MYKTIRHGENSLQYTILPQNDDFRIEGKLSSATNNNGGIKVRRTRRRTFCAYLGLLFVCTVIIGAILVPYLVSADCLPNPAKWFKRTKASFIITDGDHSFKNIEKKQKTTPVIIKETKNVSSNPVIESSINAYPYLNVNNSKKLDDPINAKISTVILNKDINKNSDLSSQQDELSSASVNSNEKYEYSPLATATEHVIDVMRLNGLKSKLTDAPFIEMTTAQEKLNPYKISIGRPTAATISTKPTAATVTISNFSTTTRLVPTRFVAIFKSTSKKPIILPVLAKTNSAIEENEKSTDQQTTNNESGWFRMHWPFIDLQSFLKLAGNQSDDSVLLPAVLGFTLIAAILIIAFCLISHNKRSIVATVRNRNRNNIEEADDSEDNATLLTSSNLSDDE